MSRGEPGAKFLPAKMQPTSDFGFGYLVAEFVRAAIAKFFVNLAGDFIAARLFFYYCPFILWRVGFQAIRKIAD